MGRYDLPTELWIDVFGYLDYLTLRTGVSLTCKYFNSLLSQKSLSPPRRQQTPLDYALFRDYPAIACRGEEPFDDNVLDRVKLHPLLESYFGMTIRRYWYDSAEILIDKVFSSVEDFTDFADKLRFFAFNYGPASASGFGSGPSMENATSPAVRRLVIGYRPPNPAFWVGSNKCFDGGRFAWGVVTGCLILGSITVFFNLWSNVMRYSRDRETFLRHAEAMVAKFEALRGGFDPKLDAGFLEMTIQEYIAEMERRGRRNFEVEKDYLGDDFGLRQLFNEE